jgi:hypothetical protein
MPRAHPTATPTASGYRPSRVLVYDALEMRAAKQFAAALVALAGAFAPRPLHAEPTFTKAIPPGQEGLAVEMLGGDTLPGKCALDRAAIDRTKVVATYSCDGKPATIELHHPSDPDAAAPALTTLRFAVVVRGAPQPLVDEIATRIRAREKGWQWISAEAPGLATVADDAPTAGMTPGAAFTPEQSEAFVAGVRLYRDGKLHEAFETFRALARQAPRNGVLGMVVASVASTSPTPEEVDRYAAEADAHPDDPLAQFVAGVAAHYCGHRNARTRAEKGAYYERAIRYLARTRPTFDFEPRVFVYLAVSHYRLGHQKEAEALIESAIPLASNDPDVYYCRAEIREHVDLPGAIADVRTYLDMSDRLAKQGVPMNEQKHARVKEMLGHLEAAAHGGPPARDLFDPLPGPANDGALPPPPHTFFRSSATFGAGALGVAVLWFLALRRRMSAGRGAADPKNPAAGGE